MILHSSQAARWGVSLFLILMPALAAAFNVPVAARIISFVQPAPTGNVPAAIIVEPGNRVSESDAAAIEQAVGSGYPAGRGTIRTRRVPVSNLAQLAGARVAFVTAGLRDSQERIGAAAARLSILTISSDPGCVRAGHCVVGISGSPRVQITVNRAAAKASNVRFASAFLMLVEEVG